MTSLALKHVSNNRKAPIRSYDNNNNKIKQEGQSSLAEIFQYLYPNLSDFQVESKHKI